MALFHTDINELNKTFDRIDKTSIELSKGIRDENIIQHTVNLIEETSTAKAQINTIRAKNDLLGTLMDIIG